jgi:hypothetical protein
VTVTTLEIIQCEKQLWREYLSSRTPENKAKIESYEKLEWLLVPAKVSVVREKKATAHTSASGKTRRLRIRDPEL